MDTIRIDYQGHKHKVLGITGATTHLGRATLDGILARHPQAFSEVRMIGEHEKDTQKAFQNLAVNVTELNHNDLQSIDGALGGLDFLCLILPPCDDADQWAMSVLEGAQRQGLEFVCFLSVLACDDNRTVLGKQFERVRNALRASGIPFVEVSSNLIMEDFYHCIKRIRDDGLLLSPIEPKKKFAAVAAIDVGKCLSEICAHPNKHLKGRSGNVYMVTGPEAITLEDDVIPAFCKVLEKEVKLVTITCEETLEAMVHHGDWGGVTHAGGMVEIFRRINEDYHSLAITTNVVKDLTGRVPLSFVHWLERNQQKFKGPRQEPQEVIKAVSAVPAACGGCEAPCASKTAESAKSKTPESMKLKSPEPTKLKSPEPTKLKSPEPTKLKSPEPTKLKSPEPTKLKSPEPMTSTEPAMAA